MFSVDACAVNTLLQECLLTVKTYSPREMMQRERKLNHRRRTGISMCCRPNVTAGMTS